MDEVDEVDEVDAMISMFCSPGFCPNQRYGERPLETAAARWTNVETLI